MAGLLLLFSLHWLVEAAVVCLSLGWLVVSVAVTKNVVGDFCFADVCCFQLFWLIRLIASQSLGEALNLLLVELVILKKVMKVVDLLLLLLLLLLVVGNGGGVDVDVK